MKIAQTAPGYLMERVAAQMKDKLPSMDVAKQVAAQLAIMT